MNLLNYLLNLPGSDLATLTLLAFLVTVMLTLAVFLVTYVRSWIAGRTSKSNLTLFLQNFETSFQTLFQFLKNQLGKDQPTQSSEITSDNSLPEQDPAPAEPSLLSILQKAVDFLKEHDDNEKS